MELLLGESSNNKTFKMHKCNEFYTNKYYKNIYKEFFFILKYSHLGDSLLEREYILQFVRFFLQLFILGIQNIYKKKLELYISSLNIVINEIGSHINVNI